jgi:hypothetical protein
MECQRLLRKLRRMSRRVRPSYAIEAVTKLTLYEIKKISAARNGSVKRGLVVSWSHLS